MANNTDGDTRTKATGIKRCDCAHAWQDKRYGAGMRAHNARKDKGWRCTVCRKLKD